ncbi:hypothetical protein [Clostridium oryzae]|uniref:ABC-2 family transporter protein n=1 Tax=Clostridium oryzae TaxID=1450648 RepID=A0A1V4IXJ3_9CLOT|nr:hypothetical protein [Clostridium oryzae]OPJ64629.1 hypothetical protein CLORY_04980 [Clostridium oryzae]
MIKVLLYEIKRILFAKIYVELLLFTLAFSYYVLRYSTILGVSNTAPFSKWSYSDFLCQVSIFSMVSMMFFCTYVFSKKEISVRTITLATPLSITQYYLLKAAAIMFSYIITTMSVIVLSFIFYAKILHFYDYVAFVEPIFLFTIPPAIFLLGLSMFLGRINTVFQYILIALIFIIGNTSLNLFGYIGIVNTGFIVDYSMKLSDKTKGELIFSLPWGFYISRFIWILIGIVLFVIVCRLTNRKRGQNQLYRK